MKLARLCLIVIGLMLLCGCATYYQPATNQPVVLEKDFTGSASVSLINGQPSTEEVKFSSRHFANLKAWTDVAISITERELQKRGVKVTAGAPKTITMAIESAKTDVGWVMISSHIVMRVTTSDGYAAMYTGRDKSAMAGRPREQMDKSMARVVAEMLNDPKIVEFLTK
jgi:hypothetical protein